MRRLVTSQQGADVRARLLGARGTRNLALLLLWAVCVGAPAILLAQSQSRNLRGIEQRFGLRASLTAGFASAFVHERLPSHGGQASDSSLAPLGNYLKSVVPLSGSSAYLLDGSGMVIASSHPSGTRSSRSLSAIDPALATASVRGGEGPVDRGSHEETWFASRSIAGTPWRVVIATPTRLLFQTVRGPAQWVPWLMLFAFALLGLSALAMFDRLVVSRAGLAKLNEDLERVARIDSLTAIHNRRHLEEALRAALGSARRHEARLSLLVVDIDHFKRFNDTHGHLAGDRALRHVAARLASGLRVEDELGRWGGEEFIVVLPGADAGRAALVAERLRADIAASVVELPAGGAHRLTVTIGVASWSGQDAEELVNQADLALYEGKAAGRNRVRLHIEGVADAPMFQTDEIARIDRSGRSAV